MTQLPFAVQSYTSRSLPVSSQRCLNCFVEVEPQDSKAPIPLFGAPGLTAFTELPEKPVRGLWNFRGTMYAVAGLSLYRINRAGGYKRIGGGITGNGVVSMSDNGVQIMVVNGLGGFIANEAGDYQQIQNPNFYSASTVLFFDNYFVFDRKGTNEFFLSGLSDGTSYSGLDFASAEAAPGFLTAVAQNLQLVFLFCQNHTEMWYDAGSADFPFQRYAGGVIERGCISPYSILQQDDALFFLGQDGVFYRLQGNVPIRVSTHAIEHAIASYGTTTDAFCFTYTLEGHKMVHLTFPSAPNGGASWVYDISTQKWHERESWDENSNPLGRWRGNCCLTMNNQIFVGDAFSGKIGILDWNAQTEYGNTIQMLADSPPLHKDRMRLFISRLELDIQAGVGEGNAQGKAPVIMLRYSKDGGQTYSTIEPRREMGRVGEYNVRQRWLNMGVGYQWCFRIVISDPVKRVVIAAHYDAGVGMA